MLSNILLCLTFCLFEIMYTQWTSWPTFPKHFFKLWCSLPEGCFLPKGFSLPKWCFLPKKFHETSKKQIGMEVSKELTAELKNKPRKRVSSKKEPDFLTHRKSKKDLILKLICQCICRKSFSVSQKPGEPEGSEDLSDSM